MPTIDETIQAFLRDFAVGRESHQTIETYAQGLKRFSEYIESRGATLFTDAAGLNVDHALGCARWLSERGIAKSTLNTYLACIARFYSYLLRERVVVLDAADLQRMKDAYRGYRNGAHRALPKLPPDETIHDLVAAARNVPADPKHRRRELERLRNIAIVESLRVSGMRVGELVTLKRGDLNYRDHSARVTGKGSKQRMVYFDQIAWKAIQDYLRERKDGATERALEDLPLIAQHGKRAGDPEKGRRLPLTTDHVRHVFRELAAAAGIEMALTPHSLRHAFATHMLETSGDLAIVQDLLGHASPITTRIYAQVSSKRLRDAHRAAYENGDDEE